MVHLVLSIPLATCVVSSMDMCHYFNALKVILESDRNEFFGALTNVTIMKKGKGTTLLKRKKHNGEEICVGVWEGNLYLLRSSF